MRAWREQGPIVGAVAAGGALGSLARYQAGLLWPTPTGGFPGTTVVINVLGCLLIGGVVVLVTESRQAHRLVQPFLATGVLGGFTTFSAFSLDLAILLRDGRPGAAAGYLALTVAGALAAVGLGLLATRRLVGTGRAR